MKRMWVAVIPIFAFTIADPASANQYLRDTSGDAMQRYDSRMPSSPMLRFPGLFGTTYRPIVAYPPAPEMQVFNLLIAAPEESALAVQNKPPASSKFWIARCGDIVEIDVSKTNLIEEESKACPR